MTAAEYLALLQLRNARFRLAGSLAEQAAKRNEVTLALVDDFAASATAWDYTRGTALSDAQTGDGASTHDADTGSTWLRNGALIRITTTIGATPTCTYALEGSLDESTWAAVTYSDSATPLTFVATTFVTTTAKTAVKFIKPGQHVRYLRITYSLNTNVTNTADAVIL